MTDLDRLTNRVAAVEAENRRLRLVLIATRLRAADAGEIRIRDRAWSIADALGRLPLAPPDVLDSIERALEELEGPAS